MLGIPRNELTAVTYDLFAFFVFAMATVNITNTSMGIFAMSMSFFVVDTFKGAFFALREITPLTPITFF